MTRHVRHGLLAVIAYAFFPSFHFLVYAPFIVPHLRAGGSFPLFAVVLLFAALLFALGAFSGPWVGVVHSLALSAWIHTLRHWFGTFNQPGYLKDADGPYLGDLPFSLVHVILPVAIAFFVIMLSGHLAATLTLARLRPLLNPRGTPPRPKNGAT